MKGRILVTPRSVTEDGHPSLVRLEQAGFELVFGPAGQQPSEAELISEIGNCVGYLAGVEPISSKVLKAATQLRVISRNGTGIDNIDLETAAELNVAVLRADGANARGVAELAIGLLLSLARSIPPTDAALKKGNWVRSRGIEVEGRTLGIVGFGRIGRIVGEIAKALGMALRVVDLFADNMQETYPEVEFVSMERVMRESDFLSLHCPSSADGNPLLDNCMLSKAKSGIYIVNTARYNLVDPEAMLAALESGRVAGFAIDAYAEEPPLDRSLLVHPRVVATSHIGGYTSESVDRAMGCAVDGLLEFLLPDRGRCRVSL